MRNAVSLGGDADTQGAIAGSIAETGGGSDKFLGFVLPRLPKDILETTLQFARAHLPEQTISALENEAVLRSRANPDGLYTLKNRYSILLRSDTLKNLKSYAEACRENPDLPGKRLSERLSVPLPWKMNSEGLLRSLLETKIPCIFAESEIIGDGSDWNREELKLLGDISIAVPVTVYDDGEHDIPKIHKEPFNATLLYTPGALLVNGRGEVPVDRNVVKNGKIDIEEYYRLYERRLLPLLKYAGIMARQQGKEALITIPGLGCGQFSGEFRGTLQTHFRDALIRTVTEHQRELKDIRAIWYDPYRGCLEERREIGRLSFFVKALSDSSDDRKLPQISHPRSFGEADDNFADCSLFSVVAWDHVSWPGNDFYHGNRSTDDGVKAAATDNMFHITGVRGKYDSHTHCYLPPEGYKNWAEVIEESKMKLRAIDNVLVIR